MPSSSQTSSCGRPSAIVAPSPAISVNGVTPRRRRDARPHTGLVDERLADVEDDRLYSHAATRARSAGVVTLRSRSSPLTIRTRPPACSRSDAQSVTLVSTRRTLASAGATNACGVWTVTSSERSRVSSDDVAVDTLDRVWTGKRRDGALEAIPECADHALDHLVGEHRPRRVVDEDHRCVLRHLRDARAHGLAARRAAGHAGRHLRRPDLLREQDRGLLPLGRNHHDHRVDPFALVETAQRLGEQRQVAEAHERLRPVLP